MDKFQKDFLSAVLTNDQLPEEFLALIKPVGRLTPENVVNVYRGDYFARLQEALGKNYEATWLLTGDEDFHSLGQKFIRTYPSDLKNLTTYGEKFPEFLKENEQEDFIVEMALFEKNYWKLFHQKGHAPKTLTPEDITSKEFDLSDLYLSHAQIRLHDLWKKREGSDEELSLDDFEGEEWLATYRAENSVEVKKLSEIQFKILNLIREVRSLGHTFEQLEKLDVRTEQEDWPLVFSILASF